ncbi:hypothetical protein [Dactylosporangium salmoneum]|uniref:Uncharacterized protein n=1 Tax=Dactylosporangium salmoneum TaxID=53361 RepID=A0ABP5SN93_9ACTN
MRRDDHLPETWGPAVHNRIEHQGSAYRTANPNGSWTTGWDDN